MVSLKSHRTELQRANPGLLRNRLIKVPISHPATFRANVPSPGCSLFQGKISVSPFRLALLCKTLKSGLAFSITPLIELISSTDQISSHELMNIRLFISSMVSCQEAIR